MHGITDEPHGRGELHCRRPTADTLLVEFSGSWRLQDEVPVAREPGTATHGGTTVQRLTFDTTALSAWDSALVTFVLDLMALVAQRQIVVEQKGLPEGLRRLLHLATAVPERQGARRETIR